MQAYQNIAKEFGISQECEPAFTFTYYLYTYTYSNDANKVTFQI